MVMLLLFQSHRNQKAVSNPACLSRYNIPRIKRVPTLHVNLHYFLYFSQTQKNNHETLSGFFFLQNFFRMLAFLWLPRKIFPDSTVSELLCCTVCATDCLHGEIQSCLLLGTFFLFENLGTKFYIIEGLVFCGFFPQLV